MSQQLANPAPLGLIAFGMTTMLLNIHNIGLFPISAMILAMGIFYGGLAQIIAGILEFRMGNTFGTTAFTSYGFFWLTLVFVFVAPRIGIADATSQGYMGWYLFLWGVFTFFMHKGTKHASGLLRFVFFTLYILFFLLALREWTGLGFIGVIAGLEGVVCGAAAFYLGVAECVNETTGEKTLPVF